VTASYLKVCEALRGSLLAREDDDRTGFQRIKIAQANFVLQEDWVMNGEEGKKEHDARLVLSSLPNFPGEKSYGFGLRRLSQSWRSHRWSCNLIFQHYGDTFSIGSSRGGFRTRKLQFVSGVLMRKAYIIGETHIVRQLHFLEVRRFVPKACRPSIQYVYTEKIRALCGTVYV
jgi:hypothetical protein